MKPGDKNKETLGSSEASQVLTVCRLLNDHGAKYLLVGGVACNLHGLIRATRDVDLLIPKNVRNTESVLEALKHLAFGVAGELDAEEVTKKPITIIGDILRVDLLTVAHRVKFEDAAKTALTTKIDGVRIPYVDFDTLLRTKATDRLQDKADIERLRQIRKK